MKKPDRQGSGSEKRSAAAANNPAQIIESTEFQKWSEEELIEKTRSSLIANQEPKETETTGDNVNEYKGDNQTAENAANSDYAGSEITPNDKQSYEKVNYAYYSSMAMYVAAGDISIDELSEDDIRWMKWSLEYEKDNKGALDILTGHSYWTYNGAFGTGLFASKPSVEKTFEEILADNETKRRIWEETDVDSMALEYPETKEEMDSTAKDKLGRLGFTYNPGNSGGISGFLANTQIEGAMSDAWNRYEDPDGNITTNANRLLTGVSNVATPMSKTAEDLADKAPDFFENFKIPIIAIAAGVVGSLLLGSMGNGKNNGGIGDFIKPLLLIGGVVGGGMFLADGGLEKLGLDKLFAGETGAEESETKNDTETIDIENGQENDSHVGSVETSIPEITGIPSEEYIEKNSKQDEEAA